MASSPIGEKPSPVEKLPTQAAPPEPMDLPQSPVFLKKFEAKPKEAYLEKKTPQNEAPQNEKEKVVKPKI